MRLLFDLTNQNIPDISRLQYIPDFITREEEQTLISNIDAQPWLNDLKRRVQHYGYRYDYKARSVTSDAYLGELPEWIEPISKRLYDQKLFNKLPDQAILNEYQAGQGISAHIDCVPCFGDTIASLSLGSGAMMQFTHSQSVERQELYLQERSLIVLSGAARYEWTHAIPARKSDVFQGFKVERTRRLSLTFRTMNID
ncbi:MAG: alpha-ketoglutarate-dependent dioxygenase AlkB [Micavibrio sp.]|nr:alpha-ketoglutarate-dependent dioxygenase AlkB [Micavibrio sp.]|tara:strand:- start:3996 stop:4589 length:594 start_codon:yes stop_codon:yes gene_type:complete